MWRGLIHAALVLCLCLQPAAQRLPPSAILQSTLNLPPLQLGDVVFRCGRGIDSAIISEISKSKYSHVGMVAALQPQIVIIHATTDDVPTKANQVIASTLSFFVQEAKRFAVKRYALSAQEQQQIAAFLHSQLGEPFVLDGKRDSLYCTTLIVKALGAQRSASLRFHYLQFFGITGWFLFPEDLWQDARSQVIYSAGEQ